MVESKIINEEITLNWNGTEETEQKNYPHILPDAYDAIFDRIEIQEVKKFESEEKIKKFLIFWKIDDNSFPFFCTTKIMKTNNPKFSNSKLYDFLEKLSLVEKVKQDLGNKSTVEAMQLYFAQLFVGKKIRISIIDAGKKDKPYSIVEKAIRPL